MLEEIRLLREASVGLTPNLAKKLLAGLKVLESRIEQIYKRPDPLPESQVRELFETVKQKPKHGALTKLCQAADERFIDIQTWIVPVLLDDWGGLDYLRCHPSFSKQLIPIIEDKTRTKYERGNAYRVWRMIGDRKLSSEEIVWSVNFMDDGFESSFVVDHLRRFHDRDEINLLLEAVVSRIESGRTNWTPYVLEGYVKLEQIEPFIPRLFALIPELIEHPDYNYHQRIGIGILKLFKKDISILLTEKERADIKKSIEKLIEDYPSWADSYEEVMEVL